MLVQIYGMTPCSACKVAKDLCEAFNIEHEYFELDKDYTMSDLMDLCIEEGLNPPRSFPFMLDRTMKQITIEQLKQLI